MDTEKDERREAPANWAYPLLRLVLVGAILEITGVSTHDRVPAEWFGATVFGGCCRLLHRRCCNHRMLGCLLDLVVPMDSPRP